MRFLSLCLGMIALLVSTGCASYFTRKECEKTNWFEYGQKVAMDGKRLDADSFVKQCQKVEAEMSMTDLDRGFKAGMGKYCTGDNIFQVGKAGKKFSYDMCDGESERKMRGRYTEGLRVFCTPSNAYRFGSSGGVYENVCPERDEEAWLTEYRKGRKIYLKAMIEEKEREVQIVNTELASMELRRSNLEFQKSSFERSKSYKKERVFDARTGTYRESETVNDDEPSKQRAMELSNQISSLGWEIDKTKRRQSDLNNELMKMRTEMAAL